MAHEIFNIISYVTVCRLVTDAYAQLSSVQIV